MSLGVLLALIFGYLVLGTITLAVYGVIGDTDNGEGFIFCFWPAIWIVGFFVGIYKLTEKIAEYTKDKIEG